MQITLYDSYRFNCQHCFTRFLLIFPIGAIDFVLPCECGHCALR